MTPDARAILWPVIPSIPAAVASGQLITANFQNSMRAAVQDLWTNLQALNQATGGGTGGGVPPERQIIAGPGLSGGGTLAANVTLSANVQSVFGRYGAVVLTAADITGTGWIAPNDTSTQRVQTAVDNTAVGAPRPQLNFVSSPTLTWSIVDNGPQNRIDITATAVGGDGGTGPAGITHVFGRTGPMIVAQAGDYSADLVTNAVDTQNFYQDPAWIQTLSYTRLINVPAAFQPIAHSHVASEITGVLTPAQLGTGNADNTMFLRGDGVWAAPPTGGPGGGITSVFGRPGPMIDAEIGDYTAAMVTNALSDQGNYDNPPWLIGLAWSKIQGAPASFPPSTHTHDAADITTGIIAPARLGTGTTPDTSVFLRGDGAWAIPPTGGPGGGAPQSPWEDHINANNFQLRNVNWIGIGTSTQTANSYALDAAGEINLIAAPDTWQGYRINGVGVIGSFNQGLTIEIYHVDTWFTKDTGLMINGRIGIGMSASATFPLSINGDVNVNGGTYRINGTPIQDLISGGTGGWQNPWTEAVSAGNNSLTGVYDLRVINSIGVGSGAQVAAAGDLGISRNGNPGAGVIYFGNTGNHYISFDGATYSLSSTTTINGNLSSGSIDSYGNVSVSGNISISGAGDFILNGSSITSAFLKPINGDGKPIFNLGALSIATGSTATNDPLIVHGLGVNGQCQIRMSYNQYAVMLRNDDINFQIALTNPGDPWGSGRWPVPFMVDLNSGCVGMRTAPNASFGVNVDSINAVNYYHNGALLETGTIDIQYQNNPVGTAHTLDFFPGTNTTVSVDVMSPGQIAVRYHATGASDLRIKQNVRDLTGGLDIIRRIRPVESEYNGCAGYPKGQRVVSAIAQELQQILPGCIQKLRAKLYPEDDEATDILCIEPFELLFQIVLAVQQLDAQLKMLQVACSR